ncbi:hypothetical protein AV530_000046 [Patagioenas fasciata monilis]|uniref:Uncharacterized protein n=1 Tax=Patagioenas fasciata monilis TaxID=372326 RepID=A0A1V4K037_PATFA|nr:hypothetical protein AV530_000046 [Patagioenas fasciata monilis]
MSSFLLPPPLALAVSGPSHLQDHAVLPFFRLYSAEIGLLLENGPPGSQIARSEVNKETSYRQSKVYIFLGFPARYPLFNAVVQCFPTIYPATEEVILSSKEHPSSRGEQLVHLELNIYQSSVHTKINALGT